MLFINWIYFFVAASKFLWPNLSSRCFSFSDNVSCTITSTPLFSYVLALILIILYWFKKILFFQFYAFPLFFLTFLLFLPNSSLLFIIFMSSFLFSYYSFSWTIVFNFSWLTSRSFNASDIKVSIIFNLILTSIRILLCFFFLFLVMFNAFLSFLLSKKTQV